METIIGTIIGGLIAAIAMVVNSLMGARLSEAKEDREFKKRNFEKELTFIDDLYKRSLHLSGKLIRDKGSMSTEELDEFYMLEVNFSLHASKSIQEKLTELRNEIAVMASALPEYPDIFRKTFEGDEERRLREQAIKKAEESRAQEAKKYQGKLYKLRNEMAKEMKNHLASMKDSLDIKN